VTLAKRKRSALGIVAHARALTTRQRRLLDHDAACGTHRGHRRVERIDFEEEEPLRVHTGPSGDVPDRTNVLTPRAPRELLENALRPEVDPTD
jgi:hypothetical protein